MNVFLNRAYIVTYTVLIAGFLIQLTDMFFGKNPVFGIALITIASVMYVLIQLARYLKEAPNEVQKPSKD